MSHPMATGSAGPSAGPAEAGLRWAEGGSGSWASTRRRGARRWARGWDRDASYPHDPGHRSAPGKATKFRRLGAAHGSAWEKLHNARRQVVRQLIRSGYLARHRWSRSSQGLQRRGRGWVERWTYEDGPAEDCEAVDPWRVATRLQWCAASWAVSLRVAEDHGATVMSLPQRCGSGTVCPLCAAHKGAALATAARQVVRARRDAGDLGPLALVTLTQRAARGEPLALAIERWRDAWRRMTRGRPGTRFKAVVAGAHYGLECTYEPGRGWHVHAHAVTECRDADEAAARAEVGQLWRDATHAAGEAATHLPHHPEGWGWDPHAGLCRMGEFSRISTPDLAGLTVRQLRALASELPITTTGLSSLRKMELVAELTARVRAHNRRRARPVLDWAPQTDPGRPEVKGWWATIDTTDDELVEVYQSCKYPTPIVQLRGLPLAEFVAAGYGRRWHDGVGSLRHVRAQARELEAEGLLGESGVEDGEMPFGESVASIAPGEAPTVDDVAPDLGWTTPPPDPRPLAQSVRWRLSADTTDEQQRALEAVGARLHEETRERVDLATGEQFHEVILWAHVPRAWVSAELRQREAETAERARRRRAAEARTKGKRAALEEAVLAFFELAHEEANR